MNSKSQSTSTDQETTVTNAGDSTTCGMQPSTQTLLTLLEKSLTVKILGVESLLTSLSDIELDILSQNYAELSAHVSKLSALVARASTSLELEQFRRTHKLQIGGTVLYDGCKFQVTRIRAWEQGKPWVYGTKLKKDGTFSLKVRCLFSGWTT